MLTHIHMNPTQNELANKNFKAREKNERHKAQKKKNRRNYSKMTANIKTSFYGLSSIERMRRKRKRRRIMILITSTTK